MSGNVIPSGERDPSRIAQAIKDLFSGRRNTTGTVTLTQNAATTVVSHTNFGNASVPHLTPLTTNAAAEIGNGTLHVSARANGSFTITHANSAAANRTFAYSFDG